ncbi:MAG: biopolymer transporter ExbD [Bacteroidota bacterium]|nr:biopolymer transporter ExbD [Bacteroidota bacterium]
MPRVKVARKSTAIDMTAMCDVAFLLLTFFILTAKPKVEDPSKAEVPPSSKMMPVGDANMVTLSVGHAKVFYSVTEDDVREAALKEMGKKYGVAFTPEEVQRFKLTQVFGVPMKQMKSFLNLDKDGLKTFQQTGIPVDTTNNNELSNWILLSRQSEKALHNKDLDFSIKGDKGEEYPTINLVIGQLEKQKKFKFNLITTLKTAPIRR